MSKTSGVTLAELLIVTAIVAVVGVCVYSIFGNTVELWTRANVERPEFDLDLAFEKMSSDLRNGYLAVEGTFTGNKKSFQVASRVHWRGGQKPARIEYAYDEKKRHLMRREHDFRRVLFEDSSEAREAVLAAKLEDFTLEYYDASDLRRGPVWKNRWQDDCLPHAVKVSLKYGAEMKQKIASRIIRVPLGGCPS